MADCSQLLQQAMGLVQQATALDTAGSYEDALRLYVLAVEAFVSILRMEKNERIVSVVRSRVVSYMERAEVLKAQVLQQRASSLQQFKLPEIPSTSPSLALPSPPTRVPAVAAAAVVAQPVPVLAGDGSLAALPPKSASNQTVENPWSAGDEDADSQNSEDIELAGRLARLRQRRAPNPQTSASQGKEEAESATFKAPAVSSDPFADLVAMAMGNIKPSSQPSSESDGVLLSKEPVFPSVPKSSGFSIALQQEKKPSGHHSPGSSVVLADGMTGITYEDIFDGDLFAGSTAVVVEDASIESENDVHCLVHFCELVAQHSEVMSVRILVRRMPEALADALDALADSLAPYGCELNYSARPSLEGSCVRFSNGRSVSFSTGLRFHHPLPFSSVFSVGVHDLRLRPVQDCIIFYS